MLRRRIMVARLLAAIAFLLVSGCGGSSSETPPPLRPLPPNVHYNRSATTLPSEQGAPDPADSATPEPRKPLQKK
ncbi:MAG TPA: hypothetical protein VGK73_21700 [Polyangiaceae bacterium]